MQLSLKNSVWDYKFSEDELKEIACGNDMKKKQWLFNRIVYNSQDKLGDLSLFSQTDLRMLFDGFRFSPRFGLTRDSYTALRNTMLNERQYIEKFQWKKI
ncbi:hypothetical protein [Treponema putidum]|uniref:hypothetical protein n=1 Tax=Treponema putidum TaxID=221027 RepID=UPI003D8A109A